LFAAAAFEDESFELLSFNLNFEKIGQWECGPKEENPATGKNLKIRWGVDDRDGKTVCMCECSRGLFFFIFDSVDFSFKTLMQLPHSDYSCDNPVSDYGLISPYVAMSSEDDPETCMLWLIPDRKTTYYSKSGIFISAIAFLPPLSENSTWFAIGTKAGLIMVLAFSGDETPVCRYTLSQQQVGAVSMICCYPKLNETQSKRAGQWRDQEKTHFFCATDDDECEDGKYSVCMHRKEGQRLKIIQRSHWSCCGATTEAGCDCPIAEFSQKYISFATCFSSGVCLFYFLYFFYFVCTLTP
jgi:hypothetical protein